jgi:hypothetical protein
MKFLLSVMVFLTLVIPCALAQVNATSEPAVTSAAENATVDEFTDEDTTDQEAADNGLRDRLEQARQEEAAQQPASPQIAPATNSTVDPWNAPAKTAEPKTVPLNAVTPASDAGKYTKQKHDWSYKQPAKSPSPSPKTHSFGMQTY